MKNCLLIVLIAILLYSCSKKSESKGIIVQNINELNKAINQAIPGSEIILANGIWSDVQINFFGKGTKEAPITLRAENSGEVFIEGQSFLHLGGENLLVSGLYFRNGYTPSSGIIRYKIGLDSVANNSRVTECVIEDFTQPSRLMSDRWVEFYGKHNQMDHCYIAGKSNDGNTLMVWHTGNKNTNNHHQIIYNYFGPRPRKGGPRAETVRIGNPQMTPGYVNVSNNYFEACNGEVEIISDKADYNIFRNNIFYKCEGSLVLRHANYGTVDGNIFIGDDDSDFYGGIRIVNTGHWITNNYFYKIKGEAFRTPLAIMNGIPNSISNRYKQVTDAVIAFNTWVDCKSPWQIGIGQNRASADVLPASEIRSLPPIRTTIANNLIYNTKIDLTPVVEHDSINGILFKNNILDNNGAKNSKFSVLQNKNVNMKQITDWLYVPEDLNNDFLDQSYLGYDFERIKYDLFGESRAEQSRIGAINDLVTAEKFKIDKKKYGPKWFSTDKIEKEPTIFKVSSKKDELSKMINQANSGDIIELVDEIYHITTSLKIDKDITLKSIGKKKPELLFEGQENTPVFEMNPKGVIHLDNITIKGQKYHLAFAPLQNNMSSAYKMYIDNCLIEGFGNVLTAAKGSFADTITVNNTYIQNCENGILLAADEKGDYNAEMVTFNQCKFINIKRDVINFYRGGYDESTIGGFLTLSNNTFTSCGSKEESGILIKSHGIVNVIINDNTFKNNPIDLVALLWGAKNNHHNNNTIINSGKIKIEEQQKLDILY
ncbi:alginate lyase [Kriegella sp. EG-1]|nr:alginate lyase [Flavobacteriaceae bacterium EG-1]